MRLDPDQCRERLVAARVARFATVTPEGGPRLVPVTFALVRDEETGPPRDLLVTAVDSKPKRTAKLARLRDIVAQPRVCLLADSYDEDWSRLWWVRADGDARVLPPDPTNESVRASLLKPLAEKYPQYRDAVPSGPIIEITVRRYVGWSAS